MCVSSNLETTPPWQVKDHFLELSRSAAGESHRIMIDDFKPMNIEDLFLGEIGGFAREDRHDHLLYSFESRLRHECYSIGFVKLRSEVERGQEASHGSIARVLKSMDHIHVLFERHVVRAVQSRHSASVGRFPQRHPACTDHVEVFDTHGRG